MRRSIRSVVVSTVVGLLLLAGSSTARAQSGNERPLEPSVGFQYFHTSQEGFSTNFPGFAVRLARDLQEQNGRAFGILGEFGLGFHSAEGASSRLASFMFGARMRWTR